MNRETFDELTPAPALLAEVERLRGWLEEIYEASDGGSDVEFLATRALRGEETLQKGTDHE